MLIFLLQCLAFLQFLHAQQPVILHRHLAHESGVYVIGHIPGTGSIATLTIGGHVRYWTIGGGEKFIDYDADESLSSLALLPELKLIAVGGSNNIVYLLDSNAIKVAALKGHDRRIEALAFHPKNEILVSGDTGSVIIFWTLKDKKATKAVDAKQGIISQLVFSPDGSLVASPAQRGTIKLWSTDGFKEVNELVGHEGAVLASAFSPDGTWLVSGGVDGNLRIWDVKTGKCKTVMAAHKKAVSCIAVLKSGRYMVTGGHDDMVRIWETASGKMILEWKAHSRWVCDVVVDETRGLVFTCSFDKSARIWKLGPTLPLK